jgi:hypothetical protein
MAAVRWRVGRHYPIHVYEGDRPVGTMLTATDAARAVAAVNNGGLHAPPTERALLQQLIAVTANGQLWPSRADADELLRQARNYANRCRCSIEYGDATDCPNHPFDEGG